MIKYIFLIIIVIIMGCENYTPTKIEYVYKDTLVDTSYINIYDTIHDTIAVDHQKHNLKLIIKDNGTISVFGYDSTLYYRTMVNVDNDKTFYVYVKVWSYLELYHSDDNGVPTIFNLDTIPGDSIIRDNGKWRVN